MNFNYLRYHQLTVFDRHTDKGGGNDAQVLLQFSLSLGAFNKGLKVVICRKYIFT